MVPNVSNKKDGGLNEIAEDDAENFNDNQVGNEDQHSGHLDYLSVQEGENMK